MIDVKYNCPESVNAMPKNKDGTRSCASCSHNIVDFTGMTNAEISAHLRAVSGRVCGIVRANQVNNPVNSYVVRIFRMAFCAVFLLGLSSGVLFGQELDTSTVRVTQTMDPTLVTLKVVGRVTDEDGEPLPFAKVWLENEAGVVGVKTDFDGVYELILPWVMMANGSVDLNIEYIGFQKKKIEGIVLNARDNVRRVDVELKDNDDMIIVGIIIEHKPRIENDPYDFGRTDIDLEDLREW